jgi:1-acyl-sn-glycerol-3-phosphate acyltransferase
MTSITQPKVDRFNEWRDGVTWYTHKTIVARLVKILGRPLFWTIMDFRGTGFDNIPSGPCILAPNHINNFDGLTLGIFLPRQPFYMTKRELFKYPVMSWIMRLSGTFPVNRSAQDIWTLQHAGRILKAGQMLCIFPEGSRGGAKAQLKRGRSGAIHLALKHEVPVIPAAIFGTQYLRLGRNRPKVSLDVGEPLDVTTLAGSAADSPEMIRELTGILMQRIAALLPPDHRGVYA